MFKIECGEKMSYFIKFVENKEHKNTKYQALMIVQRYIGDCILGLGILKWLVDNKSYAELTIVCEQSVSNLFEAIPQVKKIIILKPRKWKLHYIDAAKQCMKIPWSLIIDFKNCIIPRMVSHQQLIVRQGFGSPHEHMLTTVGHLMNQPLIFPKVWISKENLKLSEEMIQNHRPMIAICPMSNNSHKIWPIENFIRLIQLIIQRPSYSNSSIMIIAGPKEINQVKPLLESLPPTQQINLVGSTLQLAAACLKHADFCIANDTGLMHLSYVMGTPTLALFGAGNPKKWAPIGYKCSFIQAPYAHASKIHPMESLTVDMVLRKLEQMELIEEQ
jgi:heptosyltransferase-3